MYGLNICIESLAMRGIYDPGFETMIGEVDRIAGLKYTCDGKEKNGFIAYCDTPWERRSRFMASRLSDGFSWVSRFKNGDLVENTRQGSWKYGIVLGIVTEYYSEFEQLCLSLDVSVANGKKDAVSWHRLEQGDVKLASLPPEILELAKGQLISACPILKKEVY